MFYIYVNRSEPFLKLKLEVKACTSYNKTWQCYENGSDGSLAWSVPLVIDIRFHRPRGPLGGDVKNSTHLWWKRQRASRARYTSEVGFGTYKETPDHESHQSKVAAVRFRSGSGTS